MFPIQYKKSNENEDPVPKRCKWTRQTNRFNEVQNQNQEKLINIEKENRMKWT